MMPTCPEPPGMRMRIGVGPSVSDGFVLRAGQRLLVATLPLDIWLRSLASCGGLEPVKHLFRIDQAGLLVHKAAAGEDGEVGDAAHVVACGELRIRFGVYLEH